MSQDTILIPTLSTFVEDQWEKTKGITTPNFSGVFELLPNQEFQALILLGKYDIKNGKINLKLNCFLENSKTGEVLPNAFETTVQGDLDEEIGFIFVPELIKFKFTEENKEGIYNFVLCIHDNNSGEEREVKNELTFNKNTPDFFQENELESEEWRQSYYLDPKPTALISYYFEGLAKNELINKDAYIAFYVEAFNNSLFLVDEMKSLLTSSKLSQLQRNGLNILLARSQYDDVESVGFSEEELEILLDFREKRYNPLEKELDHPSELDMIWSLFFSNGKYENVEKIISLLPYKKDIKEEDVKNLPQEEIIKYANAIAASWSLETIGTYHPMVQVYMVNVLNDSSTSEYIKEELEGILSRIKEEEE